MDMLGESLQVPDPMLFRHDRDRYAFGSHIGCFEDFVAERRMLPGFSRVQTDDQYVGLLRQAAAPAPALAYGGFAGFALSEIKRAREAIAAATEG